MKKFLSIIIYTTGLLYLFSAFTKVYPINYFEYIIKETANFDYITTQIISRVIITIELCLGLFYITKFNLKKFTIPISIILLIFFNFILIYQAEPVPATITPISITSVSFTYTQNFESNFSAPSTLATGWCFQQFTGSKAGTTFDNYTDNTSNAGNTYLFDMADGKSFGSLTSGSKKTRIGVAFKNESGFAISNIPIKYTAKTYRVDATSRSTLEGWKVEYKINAIHINDASGWTEITDLKYEYQHSSKVISGNSLTHSEVKNTTLNITLNNNDILFIRWEDKDATGSDDAISIDDFIFNEGGNPLPVELSLFSANVKERKVELNWQTATELNNKGFEIERNTGNGWQNIGFVAGKGTSNTVNNYSFTDNSNLYGKVSYRLKQVDNDGKFTYSNAVEVELGLPKSIELLANYPNPFNPTTTINFVMPQAGNVVVKVYNSLGAEVATLFNGKMDSGMQQLQFDAANLTSGVYYYTVSTDFGVKTAKMMLVK